MGCSKILDMFYEYSGNDPGAENSMPLLNQIQIWLHTLVCPNCAQEIERFEVSRSIMCEDFFPYSPGLEDVIMARIAAEEEQTETEEVYAVPGGISTRKWVIAGLIILVSLATAFFGLDFQKIADETGMSFLLPVGITIGIVLTTYGALFIGSHLKELTERFGL
jgi:hypothetical protein